MVSSPRSTCRRKPSACPIQPSRAPPTAPSALIAERYHAAADVVSPNSAWSTGIAAAPLPTCAAATTPAAIRLRTAAQRVACSGRTPAAVGVPALADGLDLDTAGLLAALADARATRGRAHASVANRRQQVTVAAG